jgi:hypothetical protein
MEFHAGDTKRPSFRTSSGRSKPTYPKGSKSISDNTPRRGSPAVRPYCHVHSTPTSASIWDSQASQTF